MLTLERTTAAFNRFGIRPSYGYQLVRCGMFPPPVTGNEKPSRVPSDEVDTLIKAKVAGATEDQIKELVAEMVENRKSAWVGES